jgi:hypothetical protein
VIRQVPADMKVRYEHIRFQRGARAGKRSRLITLPKGGRTRCKLYRQGQDPNVDRPVAVGIAECSRHDNYDKKIGRTIALGRAIKQAQKAGVL